MYVNADVSDTAGLISFNIAICAVFKLRTTRGKSCNETQNARRDKEKSLFSQIPRFNQYPNYTEIPVA